MLAGRWITTSVVTIAIAIGVGHVMQYGITGEADSRAMPAPRPASSFRPIQTRSDASLLFGTAPETAPEATRPALTVADPQIETPALPESDPAELPASRAGVVTVPEDRSATPPDDDEVGLNGFGLACEEDLIAEVLPGARIRMVLDLPCAPERRVDLALGAIDFAMNTGAQGRVELILPALAATTDITASLADGPVLSARAEVPEAAVYDRVALHWSGADALSVHALEFDAGAGGEGHVSARRPGTHDTGGGYLVALGDPAYAEAGQAQIYSYPSGRNTQTGTVRLSVAARVTDQTCGRTLSVLSLRSQPDGTLMRRDHPLTFPGCDDVGRILVLKNMLEDLKIAGN